MNKVFQVRKKGWYIRLLKFMWDVDYEDFTHMCPLFWTTVISIILFIPWMVVAGIAKSVIAIIKVRKEAADKKRAEKEIVLKTEAEKLYQSISADSAARSKFAKEIYMKWYEDECVTPAVMQVYNTMSEKERIDLNALIQLFVKERLAIREAKRQALIDEVWKKNEARIARKQKINNILRRFKPLATLVLWLLAAATLAFAGWGIYQACIGLGKVPHKVWIKVLMWSCVVITLFLITLGLVRLDWSFLSFKLSCKGEKRLRAFLSIFVYAAKPFIWLFGGIAKIFVVTFQTIRNECPPVEWKD